MINYLENKKLFLVVIVVAVLAALIALVIWWPGRRMVKADLCLNINDLELRQLCQSLGLGKFENELRNRAFSEGNVEWCAQLPMVISQDSCVAAVALVKNDIKLCQKISDTSRRVDCEQKNNTARYVQDDDFSACGNLTGDTTVLSCQKMIAERHDEKFCANLVDTSDQSKCLELYFTRRALLTEDYSWCQKIIDQTGKDNCLGALPVDTDGDGLSDYSETSLYQTDSQKLDTDADGLSDYREVKVYKTDPTKSDTDGDGYTDGEEVKSGHNPLK